MSADISPKEIEFLKSLGDNPEVFVLENTYKPIEGKRKAFIYKSEAHLMTELKKAISKGAKPFVQLSSQKEQYKWSTSTVEATLQIEFPELKILRIDADTIADKRHPAYNCINNLDLLIAQYDIVLGSPTIETGISIELEDHFDSVWVIAGGTQSVNAACQTPERLREDVDRHIYIANTSNNRIGNGSTTKGGLKDWQSRVKLYNDESFKAMSTAQSYSEVGNACTNLWYEYAIETNFTNRHYKEIYLGKLRDEGYEIVFLTATDPNELKQTKEIAKATRDELYEAHCQKIADIPNPPDPVFKELENQTNLTKDEKNQLEKGTICRLYHKEEIEPSFVALHEDGLYHRLETRYLLTNGKRFVVNRDLDKITKKIYKDKSFEPDILKSVLSGSIALLEKILLPLLVPDVVYTKVNLKDWYQSSIIPNRLQIKDSLGITVNPESKIDETIRVLNELTKLVGVNLTSLETRKGQVRQYVIPTKALEKYKDILDSWYNRDLEKYYPEEFNQASLTPKNVTSYDTKTVTVKPYIDIEKIKPQLSLSQKEDGIESENRLAVPPTPPIDPVIGEVKEVLVWVTPDDSTMFKEITKDFGSAAVTAALDKLEDDQQRSTLTDWLKSFKRQVWDGLQLIDHTTRESFRSFEWLTKDFGAKTLTAAISKIEDLNKRLTLTQWLNELETGLRLGSTVFYLGVNHVLTRFCGTNEAVLRTGYQEFKVSLNQLKAFN